MTAPWRGTARPTLATARLVLSPPTLDDAGAIVALAGDFEVARWLARVPHPYPAADAEHFLDVIVADDLSLAIRDARDGAFMGTVGLSWHGCGAAELGYWLGRPHWGRGYATEAGRAVLGYAAAALGLSTIASGTFEGNAASARVLAKLGFREVGRSARRSAALDREVVHIDMRRRIAPDERTAPA